LALNIFISKYIEFMHNDWKKIASLHFKRGQSAQSANQGKQMDERKEATTLVNKISHQNVIFQQFISYGLRFDVFTQRLPLAGGGTCLRHKPVWAP
jgi:hypothetical protein